MTVESLKVGQDKTLTRFNIRTTEQKPEQVKKTILEAFGPSLERVEMTAGEAKPIPAAAAGRPRTPRRAPTGSPAAGSTS